MTKSTPSSYRIDIAQKIVIRHLALLVLCFVYSILLPGYDREEVTTLFAILAPIGSLYAGLAFQEIGKPPRPGDKILPIQHRTITRLVNWQFWIIAGLISLKAFAPNILNFQDLTLALGAVETYYCVHMGTLLSQIFDKKE